MKSFKNPKNMSLGELEIYLELKKSNLKLEALKLEREMNYYKLGYKLAKEFQLIEKIEKLFESFKKNSS